MISSLFHTAFYNPIYNALVALVALIPGGDIGIAVILLTIVIRLLLLPFSLSAARTQRAMKVLEPKLKELKEKHKGNKEKEATETLALYREARVRPFATFLTALIQIPVLLGLYLVFRYEPFSAVDMARLYSFTPVPHALSPLFLGVIPIAGKNIVLAALAGIAQFFQAHLALAGTMKPSGSGMQSDFQKVLGMQLKFVFPFLIGVISYTTSAAIALYFLTTNIAGMFQELYVRRALKQESVASEEF